MDLIDFPTPLPFGHLVIELGYATPRVVEMALAEVDTRALAGERLNVGEVLVQKGAISPAQVQEVLRMQRKELLMCRQCGNRVNILAYQGDHVYSCKRCGGMLVPPGQVDSVGSFGDEAARGVMFDSPQVPTPLLPPPPKRTPTPFPSYSTPPENAAHERGSRRPTSSYAISANGTPKTPPHAASSPVQTLTPPPKRETSSLMPAVGRAGGAAAPTTQPQAEPERKPTTRVRRAPTLPANAPIDPHAVRPPSQALPAQTSTAPSARTSTSSRMPALETDPNADPFLGQQLGNYRILRRLGEGGMATVYLAENVFVSKLVALKVLPERFASTDRFVRRFFREARLAALLDHPNIVPVWDVGAFQNTHFIAMQYIDGKSMKDDLVQHAVPYTPAEAAFWFYQVLAGLVHAHDRGVIHRDLKPDNFLIDHAQILRIADFGIARAETDEEMSLTRTGQKIGTPQFMAPELFMDEETLSSRQTDLFAVGVCLYFTTTGQFPYRIEKPTDVLREATWREPLTPKSLIRNCPTGFADLIMDLVNPDPAKRPTDALDAQTRLSASVQP